MPILRIPRSTRIRVWQDRREYGMDFKTLERAIRCGAIHEDALVCSQVITRGLWVTAANMKLYRIWRESPLSVTLDLEKHNLWPDREIAFPSAERISSGDQSWLRRMLARTFCSIRQRMTWCCSQCRHEVKLTDPSCPWCRAPFRDGYTITDFTDTVLLLEQDESVEEIDIDSDTRENQPGRELNSSQHSQEG